MASIAQAPEQDYAPSVLLPNVERHTVLSAGLIFLCDITLLLLITVLCIVMRHLFNGTYSYTDYLPLLPVLAIFVITYGCFGLYPGISVEPVNELRQSASATTLVFLGLGSGTFLLRDGIQYSRLIFIVSWIALLILVPVSRAWLRRRMSAYSWWGYPAVIFGTGPAVEMVVRNLQQQPERGLRAIAVVDRMSMNREVAGVPILADAEAACALAKLGVTHVVIIEDGSGVATRIPELQAASFAHVFVISSLLSSPTLSIQSRELCRMLTLEVRNNLLLRGPQAAKRLTDLSICIIASLFLSPLLFIIAAAIKMDSRGPAIYSQWRVGRDGVRFRIWKFRTMVENADQILFEHLSTNPAAASEWRINRKLRKDPRVTRIGELLRKTSLDELPQLWNILKGEMSLVGPRPINDDEILRYRESFRLYTRVTPGLTGLWQVSGRSDSSYDSRVDLDSYYVRNWSPWLDIYLIARTFGVVLKGDGAY
jgi:Undecaprenyl-phosphate galactose phosphotransferase WbaP